MPNKRDLKYSESVEQFLSAIREIQQLYDMRFEQVHVKDEEDQDLMHQIEFEPHSKVRSRLATILHKVRVERRQAKNFVQDYKQVIDFLETNKAIIPKVEQLLGLIRKAEIPKHREYTPRIRKVQDDTKRA
jgi:hypothetical protein